MNNSFGLIDGNIPENSSCPFIEECKFSDKNCPSPNNLKENSFSCAAARAHVLLKQSESKLLANIFIKPKS